MPSAHQSLIEVDSRGRVSLRQAVGVSRLASLYQVVVASDGVLTLIPVKVVPDTFEPIAPEPDPLAPELARIIQECS